MKCFLIALLFLGGTLWADPHYSPQLAPSVKMLYELEQTRHLLDQVEIQGGIAIKAVNLGHNASNAAWMPDERTILINFSRKRSQGSLLCSLIFELHNAVTQKQFDYFDRLAVQGQISKRKYIEEVERLEYTNALKTVQVLKLGVGSQVFPKDTFWPIPSTFEEHYQIQIESGHSQLIGNLYDDLARSGRTMHRQ